MYLLDTNVLSEPGRLKPTRSVVEWLDVTAPDRCFTATLVLAELWSGADMHPDPIRRDRLHADVRRLLATRLQGRVLSYDASVARVHARLLVATRTKQRPRPDLHIAAVAAANSLTLATRNTTDFEGLGVPLLNPWDA
jgi:predicted nucleic acid-binding protein